MSSEVIPGDGRHGSAVQHACKLLDLCHESSLLLEATTELPTIARMRYADVQGVAMAFLCWPWLESLYSVSAETWSISDFGGFMCFLGLPGLLDNSRHMDASHNKGKVRAKHGETCQQPRGR